MSVWLQDPDLTLYHGDALETLRELPAGSVDMVATSPPFYGLRDYGTGTWEGGDEGCDHKASTGEPRKFTNGRGEGTDDDYAGSNLRSWTTRDGTTFKDECGRCGARRVDRQIGLEDTPDQWVDHLVQVFRECRRVLADHGTLWVEIGDSYSASPAGNVAGVGATSGLHGANDASGKYRETLTAGHATKRDTSKLAGIKQKDLIGQPWLLAFALRADGWYLRSEIIWARPNPMPESVTDRPTKSHSTVFLLSKQPRYFYDADAIREPAQNWGGARPDAKSPNGGFGVKTMGGRFDPIDGKANARSVWTIPTEPTPFAHFATWPQKLVARMIQAGTSEHGKCPECGKPWVRETEIVKGSEPRTTPSFANHHGAGRDGRDGSRKWIESVATLGWSPSCACNSPEAGRGNGSEDLAMQPVAVKDRDKDCRPCVVLDPFAGSGTTLLVARNHQRHSIGIELNPQYCQIAAKRLQQLSLLT